MIRLPGIRTSLSSLGLACALSRGAHADPTPPSVKRISGADQNPWCVPVGLPPLGSVARTGTEIGAMNCACVGAAQGLSGPQLWVDPFAGTARCEEVLCPVSDFTKLETEKSFWSLPADGVVVAPASAWVLHASSLTEDPTDHSVRVGSVELMLRSEQGTVHLRFTGIIPVVGYLDYVTPGQALGVVPSGKVQVDAFDYPAGDDCQQMDRKAWHLFAEGACDVDTLRHAARQERAQACRPWKAPAAALSKEVTGEAR